MSDVIKDTPHRQQYKSRCHSSIFSIYYQSLHLLHLSAFSATSFCNTLHASMFSITRNCLAAITQG